MPNQKPNTKNMSMLTEQLQKLQQITKDFDFMVMEVIDDLGTGTDYGDDVMDELMDNPYIAWLYAVNDSASKLVQKAKDLKLGV